ncbi:MAG: Mrp/NBP35 family ATP-binding protein [Candidatus Electryonea clarkiae]|nr:Mrp/NBP35 family ATP-binding protein [Candidatus Electryonea clarkiae]MDP8288467.1 Mrp/NBP35 family ATP-binding protein [Candidatus Electryonea clarkiae]
MQEQDIEILLKEINYPGFSRDIVSFGIVRKILFENDLATIGLEFSTNDESISTKVAELINEKLGNAGIKSIDVQITHHEPQSSKKETKDTEQLLPEVKYIIAVASGKGGVGKSTVAANLAISLSKEGLKVGLLDADIYGPSIQMLLGLSDEPETLEGQKKLKPMEAFGIKAMSMGVLVDSNTALVWRGPMVSSAVEQLMRDVEWGELDILVIDMPPGTGDIQLTVAQKIKVDGAIIVTTPQDLALIDARKGTIMFQKVEIPVLGIIENMSYFICPHCNERSEIFSSGGARGEALKMRVPFLGEIPLIPEIREASDSGHPVSVGDGKIAELFTSIAQSVWNGIEIHRDVD